MRLKTLIHELFAQTNPRAKVVFVSGDMREWEILSIYPSKRGKKLFVDIQPVSPEANGVIPPSDSLVGAPSGLTSTEATKRHRPSTFDIVKLGESMRRKSAMRKKK